MPEATKAIRILILDDVRSDAMLADKELKRSLSSVVTKIVETEQQFREALVSFEPDLVISDYQMPSFNGMEALKITLENSANTPFIIFTGSLNEDTAVNCMHAGAADYVIKEHVKRLGPAVLNALERKQNWLQKIEAMNLLESREQMYRLMFERNPQPMLIYDCETLSVLEVNKAALNLYGYSYEEFLSLTLKDIRPPEDIPDLMKVVTAQRDEYFPPHKWRHLKKNGDLMHVEIVSHSIIFNGKQARHVLIKDITGQKKSEEALRHSEEKYRAFFENSFDAILLTATDGTIYEANPAAHDLFGYSYGEFPKNPSKLVDESDPNLPLLLEERKIKGHARGEHYFVRKNGSKFPAEVTTTLFENAETEPRSSMILRDVTIRREAEDALKRGEELLIQDLEEKKKLIDEMIQAKKKAEESDRLKTAFLQNISHEIRTPLNAIVGFSELMADPNLDPLKRKHFVQIVDASSDQLLSIISGIISMATLEAGQEHLQEVECALNDVLQNVYHQFSVTCVSPDIEFTYKPGLPDDACQVIVDQVKLMQVLINLINNAFKFTAKGSIQFGYNTNGKWIEFFISDTGIGIDPSMHELIFERFRQADNSPTRKYGGAGIGLALSKGYVEMMGGQIKVQSEIGKGSVFTFSLPLKGCD